MICLDISIFEASLLTDSKRYYYNLDMENAGKYEEKISRDALNISLKRFGNKNANAECIWFRETAK